MINKAMYYIGLSFLSLILFVVHAKFLHVVDPVKDSPLFIFGSYDAKMHINYLFASGFAIIPALILRYINAEDRMFFVFVPAIALLELAGWQVFTNTELTGEIFVWLSSWYYGIYIFCIIVMYAYIKKNAFIAKELHANSNAKEEKEDKKALDPALRFNEIIRLHKEGNKNNEIAAILGVNTSTVYRNISKHNKIENGVQ